MPKLKSHQTVESIAKKHRQDISFVRNQLKMGIAIEKEHTKDRDLAADIALQHLDEFPDYYTKLKKMESDARKEHKNFTDVTEDLRKWFSKDAPEGNWKRYNTKGEAIGPCAREPGEPKPKCLSNEKAAEMTKIQRAVAVRRKRKEDPVANRKGKGGRPIMVSNRIGEEAGMIRYCPKCEKDETREECRYGVKYWDMFSLPSKLSSIAMSMPHYHANSPHPANESKEPDHEHSMARAQLSKMDSASKRLKKKLKGEGNIEAWVQSKITKASDYIDAVADYLDSGEHNVKEAKGPCWTGYEQRGMKKKKNRMVPNCVPVGEQISFEIGSEHRDANRQAKIRNLFKGNKNAGEKTAAYSKLKGPSLPLADEYIAEKNAPTNPSLWSRIKSRAKAKFDVYPSAYANGWAAKEYKKAGGGWKTVNEDVTLQDAQGNDFISVIDVIGPEQIYSDWKKEIGLIGEAIDKSKMKCNSPKSNPVGDSLTGKSHVVKACEDGKEKLLRFGQRGVKGSPKKKGESKAYASRRNRFQTRHAKNIAKGKMSAAYWSNLVKW